MVEQLEMMASKLHEAEMIEDVVVVVVVVDDVVDDDVVVDDVGIGVVVDAAQNHLLLSI